MIGYIAAAILLIGPSIAFAQSQPTAQNHWNKDHPRRTEVNHRLNNQNQRIKTERRQGQITGAQAHRLHKEDHQIRGEERVMASQNGGHITKLEQRSLNQQENGVSRQIGQ